MPTDIKEISLITVIGSLLVVLMVLFILTVLFIYQRKQHRQEQAFQRIKTRFEKELLKSQLEIQESTFKIISQELHDNIGQMLTVVKMSLSFLKLPPTDTEGLNLLQNTKQVLSKAINDMSQLTKSLHSERIIQLGLVDSIRYELDVLKKNKLFGVHYRIEDDGYELDSKTTIFLFRMFQEIINNVIKHAQATDLFVTLDLLTDEHFLMKIEDNGKGIEGVDGWVDKQSLSGKSGIGLRSIIDRALLIGAKIEIHSRAQEGTYVTIKLPLKGQMLKYA